MPEEKESSSISKKLLAKNSGILNFVVQFAVVAILFFGIGFVAGQKKIQIDRKNFIPQINFQNTTLPGKENVDFSLFWKVYDTLPTKYIDKTQIEGQKILYGAISGMVSSLGDPYTAFFDPKQNNEINGELSGSYEGIGIQIGFNNQNRLVVIAPLKDTPADKAGLRAKDLILKIGEKDAYSMTLPQAVDLIRGPKGSSIKLTLMHDGGDKSYDATITRDQISVKSVEVEYKDSKKGKIAVMHVTRFGENTDTEWDNAVSDVLYNKAVGVVVDMRNNPGGLLTSAVHLGSDFVTGTIVKQQSGDGSVLSLPADHTPRFPSSMPVEVLINGGSASASEIFSGAIKDNRRGKLIGEKSFGKGTVQDVVPFAGGSSLHVTIAKWLTPGGYNIHGVGISPDITVEPKTDQDRQNDIQLQKALEQF